MAKVGKEGEVALPDDVRETTRLKEGDLLPVEANEDGSITLRLEPSVRDYTEEDLRMFAEQDEMTPTERQRFLAWLGREPHLFGR